jgi:hypothetical protein
MSRLLNPVILGLDPVILGLDPRIEPSGSAPVDVPGGPA